MDIQRLAIPDVLLITPRRHGDERGFFSEVYSQPALAAAGFKRPFVQDNHSRTENRGVLRGLHFQRAPRAQDKLVRAGKGAIFDVAVDLRTGSPTFGQWVGEELSAANWRQLLVPKGFAHGFLTLTEDCEVLYKVSDLYAPELEDGLAFDDPELGIDWPIPTREIITNARDGVWPRLRDLPPL